MKFENISAIIFDLDGTLTDYSASSETGLREAMKVFNSDRDNPLDWYTFKDAYDAVIRSESAWTSVHGLSASAKETRIQRFKTLFQALGLPIESNISEMAEAYGLGRSKGARLYPDVMGTLEYLAQKYTLAVLTEGSVKTQSEQITKLKIESFFSQVIISGETPWHKPDLSLYEYAAIQMDCEPDKILMAGDRLDWDIRPAAEIGMKTVLVDRQGLSVSEHNTICRPDAVIQSLTELTKLL